MIRWHGTHVFDRIRVADSKRIAFGDAQDVYLTWDGTNLTMLPLTDDTGAFHIGNGTVDFDVKVFLGTATAYVLFDVGLASLIVSAGVILSVDDVTDTSSTVTGSIHTDGGIGIAKALWVGTTSRLVGAVTMDVTLSVTGVLSLASDIDLSASGTGIYDLILKDAVADALSIRRAATDMMVFDTTTPKITITPATDITGAVTLAAALSVGTTLAVTGIVTLTERVKMATDKPVIQGMNTIPLLTLTSLTSAAAVTYTAAQVVGGMISDAVTEANAATLPTPASIVAAVPGAVVGSSFLFILKNAAGGASTITLTANGSSTIVGTATIAQNNTKIFLALITNVTGAAEAVVFRSIGTLVH